MLTQPQLQQHRMMMIDHDDLQLQQQHFVSSSSSLQTTTTAMNHDPFVTITTANHIVDNYNKNKRIGILQQYHQHHDRYIGFGMRSTDPTTTATTSIIRHSFNPFISNNNNKRCRNRLYQSLLQQYDNNNNNILPLILLLLLSHCCCCYGSTTTPLFVNVTDRNIVNSTTQLIQREQQRNLHIFIFQQSFNSEDPEIDVTPAPARPFPPPTLSPVLATRAPSTRSPTTSTPILTLQPITTVSPITVVPITAVPITLQPITNTPTVVPSGTPTIVVTTIEPSSVPSLQPSAIPIRITETPTTKSPITIAPSTISPSQLPSTIPTKIQQFVNVTVPIAFAIDIQIQKNQREGGKEDEQTNQVLVQLEEIWEQSLYDYYTTAFAERPGIRPTNVDLALSTIPSTTPKQLRQVRQLTMLRQQQLRSRQEQKGGDGSSSSSITTTIQAMGGLNVAVDQLSVDPNGFVQRATKELPSVITANQLQQSINDAGGSDVFTVVSEISTIPMITTSPSISPTLKPLDDWNNIDNRSPSSNKPTTVDIVIAFTLLLLTIASLFFWAHVLHNKRKEQLRKRRMESFRKMRSVAYQTASFDPSVPPKTTINKNSTAPPMVRNFQQASNSSTNRSISILPTDRDGIIPKIDVVEIGDNEINDNDNVDNEKASSHEEDSLDAFARQLQDAASYDRITWEELERTKKAGVQRNIACTADGANDKSTSRTNISIFDIGIGNRNDEGASIEIQPRIMAGSFPYGDEKATNYNNTNPSTPPMRLNTKNAIPWTVAGVSLAPFAQRQNNQNKNQSESKIHLLHKQQKMNRTLPATFSPYGDRNMNRSIRQSWDLDEFPVRDENGPSQFSFLYPLRRQDVATTPDARRSPDSEMSIRDDSLDITSIGTPDFSTNAVISEVRAHIMDDDAGNDDNNDDDEESDNISQSVITASMLKELDDIANYVKQYEEKKRSRTVTGSRNILQDTKKAQEMPSHKDVSEVVRMPSQYSTQTSAAEIGISRFVKSRSEGTSLGLSNEDNDDDASVMSQRLGISRFSVERPGTAPLLTYKMSQEDPLKWEMESADMSPFPSSDIDSLRYSPSKSFEKQQGATNFAKESLLYGVLPRYQTSMSDESDSVSYHVSTKRDIASDININNNDKTPSKADDMLGYIKRSIDAGRAYIQQHQQQPEEVDELDDRVSPKIRSKDERYNTIRSMFESKRNAPIVPPNESWQYAGSYTGTNTSSVMFDHGHSNLTSSTNHAVMDGTTKATIVATSNLTKSDPIGPIDNKNNKKIANFDPGVASYGSSTFSDPFQFDL